jgi:hypothetical protein
VLQMDVIKVDQDVAYIAMVVYVCCLLPMFHMCFPDARCKCVYLDVTYVSHIRCICFYLDVAYRCNGFQILPGVFFSSVSEAFFKCFRNMF